MSPWQQPYLYGPADGWEPWWAWYPVSVPYSPGYASLTFFEWVLRRRINGKWEYHLID